MKVKRKPIQDPKLYGCATCGTIPGVILTDNKTFFPGDVHMLTLTIDKKLYNQDAPDGLVISMIDNRFKSELANCQFAELHHETPLHDETYEYNTEDGKWYLVEQGQGYA